MTASMDLSPLVAAMIATDERRNMESAEWTAESEVYEHVVMPCVVDGTVLCESVEPPHVVYGLVDPVDPERIRYVGRSISPVSRYMGHARTARGSPVGRWVAQLAEAGRQPRMIMLERCPDENAGRDREGDWIVCCRERGQADLNRQVPGRCRND